MYRVIFEAASALKAVDTAKSVATRNVPVLITGESGTGKEVLAHIIHDTSERKGKFVPVNCAALPKELVESELFGSVRGAFTGAHQDREGLVTQANGGTLFLDELSELPNAMQAKLLRVLQEKKVRPIGRNTESQVDFRLVVAMNVDPHELIERRKLRVDLFYRVNVVNIHLPPLRERQEDILPLATMFLAHYAAENGLEAPTLSEEAQKFLVGHPWPGNVRQLQNEMMRISALHSGVLEVKHFSPEMMRVNGETRVISDGTLEAHEAVIIQETLAKCGGNKLLTAEVLGIGRQTLYNKIVRYGLQGWTKPMPKRQKAEDPRLEALPQQTPETAKPASVSDEAGSDAVNLL